MIKKISLFSMFLIVVYLLSGCWSSTELNELGIVSGLGIDKSEDGFRVSMQVINPSEIAGKSSTGRTEVVRYMSSGKTITEAIRKMEAPRISYLAHLSIVILGEELAKEGLGETVDVLARHEQMRSDFFIIIAKGMDASDLLNVQTPIEKVPAQKLFKDLEVREKRWAAVTAITIDDLINSLASTGKEPVLIGASTQGDPEKGSSATNSQEISPDTILKLHHLGVFKNDKFVGWLNESESKGFNYITDNVSHTTVVVPCEDGEIAVDTFRSKTKVKGSVKDGKPKIDIEVTQEANIGEAGCKADLEKVETIKELEKKYNKKTVDVINTSIKKAQEDYQSDIFGFGEVIHRADPKQWKRMEKNWDEEFSKIEVSVKVKGHIRRLGTITESLPREMEK